MRFQQVVNPIKNPSAYITISNYHKTNIHPTNNNTQAKQAVSKR